MYTTECPRCLRVGLVRSEHVIKGPVATVLLYCGSCNHTWERPDRRKGSRPKSSISSPADDRDDDALVINLISLLSEH
jgi:hypothetical protein